MNACTEKLSIAEECGLYRPGEPSDFIEFTQQKLHDEPNVPTFYPENLSRDPSNSAVLLLLGNHCNGKGFEPCLILNKRSNKVKQPGDLCCPGGSISPALDSILSKLIRFPGLPLARWPYWQYWHKRYPLQSERLSLLFATSLRESLEEMRLNPAGITFLGPMPVQKLIMFRKKIFPMAGWIQRQSRFFPNWEVEKIVYLPIQNLLDATNYAVCRLHVSDGDSPDFPPYMDYPCFVHNNPQESELLWGATYRIVVSFLKRVFDFSPPPQENLQIVRKVLREAYTNNGDQPVDN